jgi:ribosomal protein S18 acetylase RimI-like enzyme
MERREFRDLASEPGAERHIPDLLPWVHEAGNPYFDYLFGGPEVARRAIASMLASERSEISLRHTTALFEGDRPVGGFVSLSGAELDTCIRADSLLALKAVGRDGRRALLERAAGVAHLRTPPEPDQLFLSKLGVLASHRRGGRGRALLERFLDGGRERGFSRFRLDVRQRDEHTVGLYRSAGFEVAWEAESPAAGELLYAMTLDLSA